MLVLEYKLVTDARQRTAIEDALRTVQFIRNKALRLWKDTDAKPYDLNRYCAVLAKEFPFANRLNSQARQAAAERAAYAISRYIKADKTGKRLNHPQFQKDNRSVEYKTTGWKLSPDRRRITFTDGIGIGKVKMLGTRDLCQYDIAHIKRVRILRRADLYFVQFCLDLERNEPTELTGTMVGLDMGLSAFYTDSDGNKIACPTYLRQAEKRLKREQRRLSRKQKGSKNRAKARIKVARRYRRVQCQRKDFAVKWARCVVKSHDLVAIEDLPVRNLVRNRHLAKSISDAAWSQFVDWLVYFGQVFGKPVVTVPPHYTSQDCSSCGNRVKKSLSERTHVCSCGCVLDRDENAAKNILRRGLGLLAIQVLLGEETYRGAHGNEEGLPSATPGESAPLLPALAE
jgi:putative transposase